MGLRQALARWRGADKSERSPRSDAPPVYRHQADPVTGELVRPDPGDTADGERAGKRPLPPRLDQPWPDSSQPAEAGSTGGLVVGRNHHEPPTPALPQLYSPNPKPYDRQVVREAFELIEGGVDALVSRFYAELFLALGAEAFQMFPAGMSAQREDFGRALVQWVVADDPDSLTQHLEQLGDDHRKFGVEPRHYDLAGTALVSAWRQLAGDRWTDRINSAVVGSYTRLASIMIDAALERRGEPATWGGTVVAHERPQRNLAMLRIQPDRPYPFLPGQYLTVELASRPREWRRMSIAAAPRADNTVELQVRAVNATGVAAALVMHTAVGDRVRLGPPRGGVLVVEPRTVSPGGLLCVASGTGTAPISAVVESMLEDPDCPPIYVFVGARMAADLYPAERLASIVHEAGRSDRVQLYGVVSHDPSWTGLRGRVEDVVPTLKDWGQLNVDALVAGSDSMISTTVFGLVGSGVPSSRIHFDQFETGD